MVNSVEIQSWEYSLRCHPHLTSLPSGLNNLIGCLILSSDTTYPFCNKRRCEHGYPCICPLDSIAACTDVAIVLHRSCFEHRLFKILIRHLTDKGRRIFCYYSQVWSTVSSNYIYQGFWRCAVYSFKRSDLNSQK